MKYVILYLLLVAVIASCGKSVENGLLKSGNYTGYFRADYVNGVMTDTIQLTIENDRFLYTGLNDLNYGEGYFAST
ncbi:MAG: hypothetical protein PVF73_08835 [Bacteroidales bacterium]|jgi:hypothetical protein